MRRKTPHNFIFLGLFTLAEGFMLGTITARYDIDEVMMAVGACAAITLGLTIFAFQTKIDFTAMGGVLLAVLICFIIFGFIAAFFPASRTLNLVYASIGCIIFRLDMFLNRLEVFSIQNIFGRVFFEIFIDLM